MGLHKMSTTAGLGSQEYVAINNLAITAILLGLLSFLTQLADVFLVVPLAGLLCGVVAIRQIAGSNGTQTGQPLAWGGVILSIIAVGLLGFQRYSDAAQRKAHEQQIATMVQAFGERIVAGDLDKAYEMLTPSMRERVGRAKFVEVMTLSREHPYLGKLTLVKWNGRLLFSSNPRERMQRAQGLIVFGFEQAPEGSRQSAAFVGLDGNWQIDDLPEVFPTMPAQPGPPGGP